MKRFYEKGENYIQKELQKKRLEKKLEKYEKNLNNAQIMLNRAHANILLNNKKHYEKLREKENQLESANKNLVRVLSKYYALKHKYEGDTEMEKTNEGDRLSYICNTFGKQYMLTVAMEECAELIQAISKIKRYGCSKEYCDNLNEEIADVSICVGALVQMNYADVKEENDYYEKKLERLLNRAKEKEFEDSEWDG